MAQTLQRSLGPVGHLSAGQYTVETVTGTPALCCPSCAGISDLEFEVYRGGVVSQIWSCPFASCPFVEYLVLEAHGESP